MELSISGGEPFLHLDLIEMVKYAKSFNIKTVIFTSGVAYKTRLDKEVEKNYLLEFQKAIKEVKEYEPDNRFLIEKIENY